MITPLSLWRHHHLISFVIAADVPDTPAGPAADATITTTATTATLAQAFALISRSRAPWATFVADINDEFAAVEGVLRASRTFCAHRWALFAVRFRGGGIGRAVPPAGENKRLLDVAQRGGTVPCPPWEK